MLWAEEPLEFDETPSLKTMYHQLPNAIELLKLLEIEKTDYLQKKKNEEAFAIHKYMVLLFEILNKKWDFTTQQILQHVDMYPRESTENFQMEGQENYVSFGLWANLTKNPRFRVLLSCLDTK
jgi:hypothetical protein